MLVIIRNYLFAFVGIGHFFDSGKSNNDVMVDYINSHNRISSSVGPPSITKSLTPVNFCSAVVEESVR